MRALSRILSCKLRGVPTLPRGLPDLGDLSAADSTDCLDSVRVCEDVAVKPESAELVNPVFFDSSVSHGLLAVLLSIRKEGGATFGGCGLSCNSALRQATASDIYKTVLEAI